MRSLKRKSISMRIQLHLSIKLTSKMFMTDSRISSSMMSNSHLMINNSSRVKISKRKRQSSWKSSVTLLKILGLHLRRKAEVIARIADTIRIMIVRMVVL